MRKHKTRNPAFDSLESREVPSAMGMAANARAQALMAVELRQHHQAEIRAEHLAAVAQARAQRLAAFEAARAPHFAAAQVSGNSMVSVSPSRARFLGLASTNTNLGVPSTVNTSGALTAAAMFPRPTLLNAPGFVVPRIRIAAPFLGGFSRSITVTNVARAQGPTALVGNLRVSIPTITNMTTTTGNTALTSGSFATGATVAFRNGLPVTTSTNTANTFANTSQAIMLPNGFPNTTGLASSNLGVGSISPAIQFANGFPTTTGFTPVFTTATTVPVVQTSNGLTMIV